MLKSATATLLVFTIINVSLTLPVSAQQPVPAKETLKTSEQTRPDLREVFAKETARLQVEATVFDPVKTDRENANQQAQKKGWSKRKTTLVLVAVIAGIAVGTFFLIKYAKKCLRYSEFCTIDPNTGIEDCPCEEYEQRNP